MLRVINMALEAYEIDPDGDVFVCLQDDAGDDEVTTVTVRCSSKVLSLASPVFKAMLQPAFRAGHRLQQTGSTEVNLEDDDWPAMLIILYALHLQNQHVSSAPSQAQLFEIAVLADKYDLYQALRPWHELWLNRHRSTVLGGARYEQWLFIAWVFRDSDIFKRTTRKLLLETVINGDGEIVTRLRLKLPIGLPDAITDKLRSQRQSLLDKISQYISGEIRDYTHEPPGSRCKQHHRCSAEQQKVCDALSVGAIVTSFSKHSLSLGEALATEYIFAEDLLAELKIIPKLGAQLHYTYVLDRKVMQMTHAICGSRESLAAFAAVCEQSVVGLDLDEFVQS